jgi:hypothetical protein
MRSARQCIEIPDTIIAVLQNRGGAEALPAKAAWKIDVTATKFVELPAEGLRCPREGVIGSDGGR